MILEKSPLVVSYNSPKWPALCCVIELSFKVDNPTKMNGKIHTPFTTIAIRFSRPKTKTLSRPAQNGITLCLKLVVSCADIEQPGLAMVSAFYLI